MNPAESKLEPEKELHPDKGFSGSDAKSLLKSNRIWSRLSQK